MTYPLNTLDKRIAVKTLNKIIKNIKKKAYDIIELEPFFFLGKQI